MAGTPEDIWNEFSSSLHQFIVSRVDDRAAADDILQEVFIKITRSVSQLRDATRLRPWLYRITRNAIIDHFRQNRPEVPLPENLQEHAGEGENQAEISPGLASCVRVLINRLPRKYREAIELTEFGGLTQIAMGEKLGLSPSGAKSRTQRARIMIRELLLECCCFELDRQGNVLDYHTHSESAPKCCDGPQSDTRESPCG
jgi:RNA polymerase sigma-70 factor (ECF subfamily)